MQSKLPAILVACLVFCISSRGAMAGCALQNIVVTQAGTGGWAHGQPVYAVTVKNTCVCPQSGIELACDGFSTTLEPDMAKFQYRGDGKLCLLNNGEPLAQGQEVSFSYAWSSQFPLQPAQSTMGCSR
ncbi:unnamed protein product [Alopecurus aequalis]